ncbi:IS200/IS605 family accessory protein TnpB-related protein [Virgibacillus oceani]
MFPSFSKWESYSQLHCDKIVNLALEEKVDTIIIGKNEGWKQKINIGKTSNQSFVSTPHAMLINMITYKAEKCGIRVITIEESYTSKASFIDGDDIPIFDEKKDNPVFTGKRVNVGFIVLVKDYC